MNHRERIYTALAGELPDQVPWSIYRGLLPRHKEAERLQKLGLAIVVNAGTVSLERPNVKITTQALNEVDRLWMRTYQTPVGYLQQIYRIETGYGSSWTIEYPVKEPKDYAVLEFIINDAVYCPNYDSFQETDRSVGDAGFVMTSVERTPIQKLWIEYTGIKRLSIDLHENRDIVENMLNTILAKQRQMWEVVANLPAEYVWCPDNITGAVVGPPLFERYIVPYYQELATFMHTRGKRLVAHMDGMMHSLVDYVAKLDLDVIEAFTPPPDGNLSLAEARRAWKDKVIWINFPSSMHVAEPNQIREMTCKLLEQVAPGDRILFGVTENVPDRSWRQSLRAITEAMNEYGRCPIANFK
jgi:hypothetical protein